MVNLRDGEPCDHKGCLHHITHPCEGCGRIAGQYTLESGIKLYESGFLLIYDGDNHKINIKKEQIGENYEHI